MDNSLWDALVQQLACLPGAIGIEGVNPTCLAYGMPAQGYLQVLYTWSPLVGIAAILFGLPIAFWFVTVIIAKFGTGLAGRR